MKGLSPLPGDPSVSVPVAPSCHRQAQKLHSRSLPGLQITPWIPDHSLDSRTLQDQWVPPNPCFSGPRLQPGKRQEKKKKKISASLTVFTLTEGRQGQKRSKRSQKEKANSSLSSDLLTRSAPSCPNREGLGIFVERECQERASEVRAVHKSVLELPNPEENKVLKNTST